jgi:hypothetical protein
MSPSRERTRSIETGGSELIFGLVGAIGTDVGGVTEALADVLSEVNYISLDEEGEAIRLSDLLREIPHTPWSALPQFGSIPEDIRYEKYMDAGDLLRRRTKRGDSLAVLAVGRIRAERKRVNGDSKLPIQRRAYVLRSLKRPEEVELLRKIYGSSFL